VRPERSRAELRAALAVAGAGLRIHSRYRVDVVNVVFWPLYQFLVPSLLLGTTVLVSGRAVGLESSAGTADVAGFLALGALATGPIYATGWLAAYSLKRDLDAGTLEPHWLTPTAPTTLVLGHSLRGFLISVTGGTAVVAVAVAFFGARLRPELLLAVPPFAMAVVGLLGVAYLMAAGVLAIKEPAFFIDVTTFLLAAASGVFFPITVLPDPLEAVCLLLPTTYALDLLRVHALDARPLLPVPVEYLATAVFALVMPPLGRWVFVRTDRRLRRSGALAHY
jgi:ABC-2 type transport system permease protein